MKTKGLPALLLVVSCVALPGPASAQSRGNMNGGWGGVDLLLNPTVQKELNLDQEQIEKAKDLSSTLVERQKVIFGKLEGLSGETRSRKVHELASEHAEDGMKAVGKLLNPEQIVRFRQIDLQQRGASAYLDAEVAKSLRISAEQADQIQPILDRSILHMREALSSTRGDRRASSEKIQTIRKETDLQAIACLNEAQKTTWEQMIGRPLDLSPASRSRP